MTHHGDTTTPESPSEVREEQEQRFERPDLAGPRGNQDIDRDELARAEDKLGRMSTH